MKGRRPTKDVEEPGRSQSPRDHHDEKQACRSALVLEPARGTRRDHRRHRTETNEVCCHDEFEIENLHQIANPSSTGSEDELQTVGVRLDL